MIPGVTVAGGRNDYFRRYRQLQRLPDYAQRAQRLWRAYAENARSGTSSENSENGGRSVTRPPIAAIPPVLAEVRDKWVQWNDPAAKHERRKRRTSRALTLWIVLSLLCVLYALAGYTGITGGIDGWQGAFRGLVGTVVFSAHSVRSGIRMYQLSRMSVPPARRPSTLPRPGSAAREPMERLARSESSLAELLDQLSTTSAPVPPLTVEQTRSTAAETASALRALASRIESVERARASAPAAERPALDSAIAGLREQLEDGVEEYGALVAAAGRTVAATDSGVPEAKDALTDATDRLAGLASALRELSSS